VGVTLTALRLLQFELQDEQGNDWWLHPPQNKGKTRPSVLDVERLPRHHREELQQGLADWLDNAGKWRRLRQAAGDYVTARRAPVGPNRPLPMRCAALPPRVARYSIASFAENWNALFSRETTG
jgi:hypothetical protein